MCRAIKGLLIKDFKLMKSQMRFFFAIMVVWGVFMANRMNLSFFVGYIAILCSFMTLTTLNYDEFENGSSYLMTLPVSRKDYILEKYLFGFLITMVPYLAAGALSWIVLVLQGAGPNFMEYLLSTSISLPTAYLLLILEIPLQIKCGQEKSRVISGILIGTMSAGIAIISHLSKMIDINGIEIVNSILGLSMGVLVLIVVAVVVLLILISFKISCIIMEKKEF